MIYGYGRKVNGGGDLMTMREVSVQTTTETLRLLARHILDAAERAESDPPVSENWHVHLDEELRKRLGCDFIVLAPPGAPHSPYVFSPS